MARGVGWETEAEVRDTGPVTEAVEAEEVVAEVVETTGDVSRARFLCISMLWKKTGTGRGIRHSDIQYDSIHSVC